MKSSLVTFALFLTATQAHALPGFLTGNTEICRDTFVSMMSESTAGSGLQLKKQLTGVDKKTGTACTMNIKYAESAQRQGRISVEVPKSGFVPFNHEVYTSNDVCNGNLNSVQGRYSFRQSAGWHKRFTTKLAITKLSNGQLEVKYAEEGPALTCVGTIK